MLLLYTREGEKNVSYYFSPPYLNHTLKFICKKMIPWGSISGDQTDTLTFHFHATC